MTRKSEFLYSLLSCLHKDPGSRRAGELVQTWQASQDARFQDSGSGPERCANGHSFCRVGSGSQSRRLRAKERVDCTTAAQ